MQSFKKIGARHSPSSYAVCLQFIISCHMATNTGDDFRRGAVKDRSQTYNPKTEQWVKRDESGRFIDVKKDGEPFKGVTKEKKKDN